MPTPNSSPEAGEFPNADTSIPERNSAVPYVYPEVLNGMKRDRWVARMAKEIAAGSRVLDLGAGACPYRPLFAHCTYEAQDFSAFTGSKSGIFRSGWDYGKIDYICDATSIPVSDGSFDVVVCTEVLEHVPEPIRVIQEISRLLKPGGKALISSPLGSGLHQLPYHFYGGYTPRFYEKFLRENGFSQVKIESNGLFFQLLAQEMYRGRQLVGRDPRYRFHPFYRLLQLLTSQAALNWFLTLDRAIPVPEFTIGYHVEAIKAGPESSGSPNAPGI